MPTYLGSLEGWTPAMTIEGSDIRHIIQVYCYPYFSTPMCRADIADHIDMHMTYVNHKFMPQIIDTLLMHSPECIIGRMAQLPYRSCT